MSAMPDSVPTTSAARLPVMLIAPPPLCVQMPHARSQTIVTCALNVKFEVAILGQRVLLFAPAMIEDVLRSAIQHALAAAGLPEPPGGIVLTVPKHRAQGDWTSPVALALARVVGRPPREVAAEIQARLEAAEVPHVVR